MLRVVPCSPEVPVKYHSARFGETSEEQGSRVGGPRASWPRPDLPGQAPRLLTYRLPSTHKESVGRLQEGHTFLYQLSFKGFKEQAILRRSAVKDSKFSRKVSEGALPAFRELDCHVDPLLQGRVLEEWIDYLRGRRS